MHPNLAKYDSLFSFKSGKFSKKKIYHKSNQSELQNMSKLYHAINPCVAHLM